MRFVFMLRASHGRTAVATSAAALNPRPGRATDPTMSETPYVVQKVDWYQFRAEDGEAFFVMVASLPNGFYTAVPCELTLTRAPHGLMALAATPEEALAQLQGTLAGKSRDEIFPPEH